MVSIIGGKDYETSRCFNESLGLEFGVVVLKMRRMDSSGA